MDDAERRTVETAARKIQDEQDVARSMQDEWEGAIRKIQEAAERKVQEEQNDVDADEKRNAIEQMAREPREIMCIKLSGGRFKEAKLPLAILVDLTPLQNVIVDVAKWLFKKEHGRERSPSSFDQIYMNITELRGGSTIAKIDIDTTRMILDGAPVPNQEYFERAVNLIGDDIRLAEQGTQPSNGHIPAKYMAYFNRIGRSLACNEVMEITTTNQRTARLTQKSREVLVRHSVGEIMRYTTVRGVISEADFKNMKFRLEQIYGSFINCPLPEQYKDTVHDTLGSYKNRDGAKTRVRVQMTGTYDRQDRLLRVETVSGIEQLDPLDVDARLDEFRNLRDGWIDEGVAPRHKELDWLSDTFGQYYPDDLQLPRTYPTADGGVSLEWSAGNLEIDIEIDLNNHTGKWIVFNKDSRQIDEEKELKLDEPDSWGWMSEQLQALMGS